MLKERFRALRQKRVQGSVLFTVLVVMMVLIVFLMGTLGLASAANRRSQNAFTSSQAQYTARAVVEGTVSALRNAKEFKEGVDNQLKTNRAGLSAGERPKMTIDGKDITLPKDGSNYGTVDNVVIQECDPQHNFNETTQNWEEVSVLKITATVHSGTEVQTFSTFIAQTQTPYRTSVPGGGGSTVNNILTSVSSPDEHGTTTTMTTTSSIVTGATGGTVTGPSNPRPFIVASASIGSAGAGNCPGVFGGMMMNMGIEWLSSKLGLSDYSYGYALGSTTSSDNEGNCFEAPLSVNGSFSINGRGARFIFPSVGTGVTVWGDMLFANDLFIGSGNPGLKAPAELCYTDIPYIYVEGKLTLKQALNRDKSVPLNLFVGQIETDGQSTIAADIYLTDPAAESTFKTMNDGERTVLMSWSGALVTGTPYYGADKSTHTMGNIYSLGNVQFKENSSPIDGSLVIDGNLKLNNGGTLKIGKDLVVKGEITGTGNVSVTGKIYTPGGATYANIAGTYDDIKNYPGYQANKAAYSQMLNTYDAATLKKLVDGDEKNSSTTVKYSGTNMSPNNRPVLSSTLDANGKNQADESKVGVYPWYMQKTWILGLFNSADNALGVYSDGVKMRSRQIIQTPQDEAASYWNGISGTCYHNADGFLRGLTNAEDIGMPTAPGRKVFTPKLANSYGVIRKGNYQGSVQIDLPDGMKSYKIIVEDGVTFQGSQNDNTQNGYIVFNDLKADGTYDGTKVLYIMFMGNVSFNQGAGIITKDYENKLYATNAVESFQITGNGVSIAGAKTLNQPKIYMYTNTWPYADTGANYDPSKPLHTMRVDNASCTLMTGYLLAPGFKITNYGKAEHQGNIKNKKFIYNGFTVGKRLGGENGETIGWIGAVLASNLQMCYDGPLNVLNYPLKDAIPDPEGTVIPPKESQIVTGTTVTMTAATQSGEYRPGTVETSQIPAQTAKPGGYEGLQWYEYWTQNGYDAF